MEKLNVFSKKLNSTLSVACSANGEITVSADNIGAIENITKFAWNNGWSKGVWANTFQWLDGWKNGWSKGVWANTFQWLDGWKNGWANNKGGGGCYITTACVEHKGLADDCDELETMRRFRDIIVEKDEKSREKVLEYYEKAPLIVRGINQSEDRDAILDDLYDNMIIPCVRLLKENKMQESFDLYLSYYEKLAKKYTADKKE